MSDSAKMKEQGGSDSVNGRLRHIAFIMDGNGRWATARGKPREFGHIQGAKTMFDTASRVFEKGIPCMTVYAFSTENWARPKREIDALTALMSEYIKKARNVMDKDDIQYHFIGDLEKFGQKTVKLLRDLEKDSSGNRRILNTALNYGGRDDVIRAANKAILDGKIPLTEEILSTYSDTAHCPDPDLIVRTGGEMRLSNFLLWQAAYAEFYSTPVLWPDFDENELQKAIDAFAQRKRRFGGLKNS